MKSDRDDRVREGTRLQAWPLEFSPQDPLARRELAPSNCPLTLHRHHEMQAYVHINKI